MEESLAIQLFLLLVRIEKLKQTGDSSLAVIHVFVLGTITG